MNHSTIKTFTCTSLQESEGMEARNPSPPILIPDPEPIQADQQDVFSEVLVTSLSCPSFRKSYGAAVDMSGSSGGSRPPSLDNSMPRIGSLLGQSLPWSSTSEFNSATYSGASSLRKRSLSLGQRLGERDEDLCIFMSEEIMAKIPQKKMLRNSCKRGHTWDHKILVHINKKKGVKVHAFLSPKIRERDGSENTNLQITAKVRSNLLTKLRWCSQKYWVMVDTDVMDRDAGKSIHRTEGQPQPIKLEDGQVNFSQVLVPYEEVKSCTCEHVTLLIKVMFITAPNVPLRFTETLEDGFAIVEKEEQV